MSKCALLFDDDKITCTSPLHSKQIEVCLSQGCLTIPLICCSDCAKQLHNHQENDLIEKSSFINSTNKKYQQIQDQVYTLEGEFQLFEKKGLQARKQFNGDVERLRIQLNRLLDSLKESTNKLMDNTIHHTKNQVAQKVKRVNDSLNFKAQNISKISTETLRKVINAIWYQDYGLEINEMKQFFPNFQQSLKSSMQNVFESVCTSLTESSNDLRNTCLEQIDSYKLEKNQDNNSSSNTSTNPNELIGKLEKEKENLKIQMEQHILSNNCTHKGCHRVQAVKAYYGYYYHVSGYAIQGELPISVCAKSKKLAEQMNLVVNKLYALGYRDSKVDDCVQAYFIY